MQKTFERMSPTDHQFKHALRQIGVITLAIAMLAAVALGQQKISDLKPTVILISLDGFRADYLDKFDPPTLKKLAKNGVRAKWMIPSFPTKTFPNHYTLVTGLYPEHHGIVENNVYDFGTVFSMSKLEEVENPRWWLGEPIWVTAEKQGQHTGAYFFPATATPIEGILPEHYRRYNGRVPNDLRVDTLLSWLDVPQKERPTFLTLYFSDTDDAGHEFGPESIENKYAAWNVDRSIGRLIEGLRLRGIDQKVNIIVVSDHGMAPVDGRKIVFLDDHFNFDLADKILWTNEIVQIFPKPGKLDEIYDKVKNIDHSTCWKKQDIPERLHYTDGPRVAPIVCSSEEGWGTTSHARYKSWVASQDEPYRTRGAHGYDNKYESMRATFIASGPAFKRGYVAKPFANVEVYNVVCKILGLKPAPNDGDLDHVRSMLR
ncbi:MAG: alkaline phosphatase family protein [Acidobacteria bacterium]|nr:alkaline phosphatase family protein [Acidobacteriota bacterium]